MLSPENVAVQRRTVGITQHALAQQAGVSQSLIAKIERGLVRPTYVVMKKIDAAFVQHRQGTGLTARDIAQHKPIFCSQNDTLKKVIRSMDQHKFSQLPVRDGSVVGLITEREVFAGICNEKTLVREVMQPPPPIIHGSSSGEVALALLDYVPLIIVQEGSSLSVITKADIFHLYRKKIL